MSLQPAQRTNPLTVLGDHEARVRALEREQPGRWIYVGTYPDDLDTTPDSPPFENGWMNYGTAGDRRMRFRRTRGGNIQIAGAVVGGTDGSVVFTAPQNYRITEREPAVGVNPFGEPVDWSFEPDGSLIYMGTLCCGGDDPTAIHYEVDETGPWIDVEAGPPGSGEPNTEFVGQAQILFSSKGTASYYPVVLRASQDDGVNWTEFSVGYGIVDLFAGDFTVWDSSSNPIFKVQESNGSLTLNVGSGTFQINAGGGALLMDSAGNVQVQIPTGQGVSFWDNTFSVERFAVDEDGEVRFRLGAGQPFTLLDSSGNPMLKMIEGDPNLYIKTGGNVIASL